MLGVTVEGELGMLGGIEDGVGSGMIKLTDPDEAVKFIELTGVDALALAIGTSHGAYKFKVKPKLELGIISAIQEKLPGMPLVMHGSSSVPAELLDAINQYRHCYRCLERWAAIDLRPSFSWGDYSFFQLFTYNNDAIDDHGYARKCISGWKCLGRTD